MTKRTLAAGLVVLLTALPMRAGFHDVAHAIGRRPGETTPEKLDRT